MYICGVPAHVCVCVTFLKRSDGSSAISPQTPPRALYTIFAEKGKAHNPALAILAFSGPVSPLSIKVWCACAVRLLLGRSPDPEQRIMLGWALLD